jgi:hypothetical protein
MTKKPIETAAVKAGRGALARAQKAGLVTARLEYARGLSEIDIAAPAKVAELAFYEVARLRGRAPRGKKRGTKKCLRAEAPDLADLIDDGRLTLAEAWAANEERVFASTDKRRRTSIKGCARQ